MLIAAQFMTSAFVPFAYAAEATTAAPTPAPYTEDEQKPTDSDNEILKKVSDINGVADLKKDFDNAMNGNASGNGATSDGTDIGDANAAVAQQSQQKREANLKEKKDQQVNGTSSNGYTTYQAVRQDGSFVTVTKNPCYHSTNEQVCPSSVLRSVREKDSKGEYRDVQRLNNDMEYYTSDGIAVDAAVLQSIEIQKQQAKMLSSTSTSNPSEYASNLVTATSLSLQNIDLPAAHKLAILAITYQQAMNEAEIANEEKMAAQKAKEKENAKLQERIQERKDSILRKEQIQKEMNILSVEDNNGKTDFNKTSFFTVSIDPGFPTTIDGKNVELTLKPKDKEKAKNGTMTASFKNLKEGRTQTIPVTEQFQNGDPIIVEMGNWDDRPEGQRTVTFTYTPNDGGKKEIYIVRYTVSAYLNTLNSEGQTTRNSVVSAILNAPLSMETDERIAIAGKVSSATWDMERSICRLVLDDTTGIQKDAQAVIETSHATKDSCKNASGKYATFDSVLVQEADDNSYLFRDVGGGDASHIGIDLELYNQNQSAYAREAQENTAGYTDADGNFHPGRDSSKVVRVDPATGKTVLGLAGSLGYDYTLLPNGQMVSVHTDDKGEMKILKVTGSEYSNEELADLSNKSGVDLSKVSLSTEDGLVIIKDSAGNKVNSNSYADTSDYDLVNRIGSTVFDSLKHAVKTDISKARQLVSGLTGSATDK